MTAAVVVLGWLALGLIVGIATGLAQNLAGRRERVGLFKRSDNGHHPATLPPAPEPVVVPGREEPLPAIEEEEPVVLPLPVGVSATYRARRDALRAWGQPDSRVGAEYRP